MATDTNLSAVLHATNDLRMEERPIPQPGRNEVQIAMNKVGICGSDVHFWTRGRIGDFVVREPLVLGHESSGTVVALGEGVSTLSVGDRVAIEPGVSCRQCTFCKRGRYNLCRKVTFCAAPPDNGTLARYLVHAADFCHRLPDNVSFEQGALLEPLSVAVHACRRGGVELGDRVLVAGAGPIGLVNLLTAKAMGASTVIVTDIDNGRLAVARQLGADHTVNVFGQSDPKAIALQVQAALGGDNQPRVSIECSGALTAVQSCIYATEPGGVVVLVGHGHSADQTLPIADASLREVDIHTCFRYANCYPTALEMVASGRVDVRPLITHRYELADALQAFDKSKSGGADGAIKVMISCEQR